MKRETECTFREIVNIGLVILSANSICGEKCVRNTNRYPHSHFALLPNWPAKNPKTAPNTPRIPRQETSGFVNFSNILRSLFQRLSLLALSL